MPTSAAAPSERHASLPVDTSDLQALNLAALETAQPGRTASPLDGAVGDDGAWRTPDGRRIVLHGRFPLRECERQLAKILEDGYPERLVVIGLGLGYLLDVIETWPVATRVLAIEPDGSMLGPMLQRRDWRDWIETGRLQIVAGPDYAGAGRAWTDFSPSELPPIIVHPVIARELNGDVLRARMLVDRMRFGTALDPRLADSSQSMLHHHVLVLLEHLAASATAAVLEIGAYVGGSTMAICRGLRQVPQRIPFWSMEKGGAYPTHPHLPSDDIFGDLQRNLRRNRLERFVTLVQAAATDTEAVARLQAEIAPVGLSLFSIDADGKVGRDFDHFLHLCRPGCVIVVDDYSSPHAPEKVEPTRQAVDEMVAAGILEPHGVHGWGTWIGRVVRTPVRA